MTVAINQQAREQIAGVNAGAGQAIGGYRRGAAEARRGVDENYRLELGANQRIYRNPGGRSKTDSQCRIGGR